MDGTAITMDYSAGMKAQHIEQTIKKERGRLLNFIKKSVPSVEDAEDVLQDVFYQLVSGYDDIQSVDRVTSWLYRVARNRIIDLYRKKKPEPFSRQEARINRYHDDEPLMLQDILPDFSQLPDQEYFRTVIWEAIEAALDEMPREQREVFVWHEFDDMSFKQMVEKTGESQNTLLSRKRYAVLFLRKKLKELYDEL